MIDSGGHIKLGFYFIFYFLFFNFSLIFYFFFFFVFFNFFLFINLFSSEKGDFGLSREGLKTQYKDTLHYKGLNLKTLQKLDYRTRFYSFQKGKQKYHSVVGTNK